MSCFEIEGGRKLFGDVSIPAAKNAVLPILAASVISDETTVIENCPNISDVSAMVEILSSLGAEVRQNGRDISVSGEVKPLKIDAALAGKMRSSVFLLGSLLASSGYAVLARPGGCNIGARPIDIHVEGLKGLNVKIQETSDGFLICDGKNMRPGEVRLKGVSVGATENMMTASVLLPGRTVIKNAAKEPEIVDLQNFLNASGAKISGAGTDTVEIEGVQKLHGTVYGAIPDRIVAGTLMCAVAACGGEVRLTDVFLPHLDGIIRKLAKSACKFSVDCANIVVFSDSRPKAFGLSTGPYPQFPTDMQSQFMTVAALAKGKSVIRENLFETRFRHAEELQKLGAEIVISGQTAFVNGVERLLGTDVCCHDLRGGAATVLAALAANGKSVVSGIEHVDRGYEKFENTLASLGAVIKRKD